MKQSAKDARLIRNWNRERDAHRKYRAVHWDKFMRKVEGREMYSSNLCFRREGSILTSVTTRLLA
jgi:hypothetical protein